MIEESSEKSALMPRMRFSEFQDSEEWEAKSLGSVCNVLQGYGFPESLQGRTEGRYPFCKVSDISRAVAENGGLLAKAANYVGDSDLLELRAKLIPIGTTVFAKIGEALRLNRRAFVQHECLIDNNAVGLKGVEGVADDYFIYLLSQLIDLNEHCGGAVPSVNKSTLEAIKVIVPEIDEQEKIAASLHSLDELITAEAQKLDALKTHKKGLMQQLFPREGETVPRLRFPEFREAGEWVVKTLSELAENLDNRRIPVTESDRIKGAIPYYGASGIVDYIHDFIFDEDLLCISEDGANLVARTTPIAFSISGKTWVNNHAHVLKFDRRCVQKIVEDYLNSVSLEDYLTGMAQPKLNRAMLDTIPVPVPQDVDEQQAVADCLSSLDDLITAQSQKIDTLKTHKKGLMQQLFPVLDEVQK